MAPSTSSTKARSAARAGTASAASNCVANNMTKSTITARRRIMAIFPGRRPRWRNTYASLAYLILVARARLARRLRRCDRSSRGADRLRAERNALHGEDGDPTQYQRTAENNRHFDHGEQSRAQHRVLQPHDEVIVQQIKAIGIGGQAVEQPRMFGGEMQADGDQKKNNP